ncbi:MAG TPA: hypothetical protein VHM90_07010 [Phycisphaerae bacterium]|nr:hypothetical protein [Phycisphaerae bacterium]
MTRLRDKYCLAAVCAFAVAMAARGDDPKAGAADGPPATIAVLVPPDAEWVGGAVAWEWALQNRMKLDNPALVAELAKEHFFVLSSKATAADVVAFSKYVDADYLLAIVPGDQTTFRLVNGRTGRVVVDGTVKGKEAGLIAGVVRARVMAALYPGNRVPAADEKEEIAYWRKAARDHMPKPGRIGVWDMTERVSDADLEKCRQAIEGWENVLALDSADVEARLNLGLCTVGLVKDAIKRSRDRGKGVNADAEIAAAIRGSQLVEAALLAQPSAANNAVFLETCAGLEMASAGFFDALKDRVAEMDAFVVEHPAMFKDWEVRNAHLRAARSPKYLAKELEAAANPGEGASKDAYLVVSLFMTLDNSFPDKEGAPARLEIAGKYLKSGDPLVAFMAEYVTAEALMRDFHDASCLAHFDRMLELHEAAYKAVDNADARVQRGTIDAVYRYRFNACEVLGKADEARDTIIKGAKHFMAAGRFDNSVAWTYYYAVTHVLKDDPEAALPIAEAYIKAKAANHNRDGGDEDWLREVMEYQKAEAAKMAAEKK